MTRLEAAWRAFWTILRGGSVVYGADVDGELRPRNQRLFMSDVWIKKLNGDWQATNRVRCPDDLNVK